MNELDQLLSSMSIPPQCIFVILCARACVCVPKKATYSLPPDTLECNKMLFDDS